MQYRISIVRIYRVERRIDVEIDSVSAQSACEMIGDGCLAVPAFDDPRWRESRSLEHEESWPA